VALETSKKLLGLCCYSIVSNKIFQMVDFFNRSPLLFFNFLLSSVLKKFFFLLNLEEEFRGGMLSPSIS
jgi:hypothetical protein